MTDFNGKEPYIKLPLLPKKAVLETTKVHRKTIEAIEGKMILLLILANDSIQLKLHTTLLLLF